MASCARKNWFAALLLLLLAVLGQACVWADQSQDTGYHTDTAVVLIFSYNSHEGGELAKRSKCLTLDEQLSVSGYFSINIHWLCLLRCEYLLGFYESKLNILCLGRLVEENETCEDDTLEE